MEFTEIALKNLRAVPRPTHAGALTGGDDRLENVHVIQEDGQAKFSVPVKRIPYVIDNIAVTLADVLNDLLAGQVQARKR